MAKKIITYLLDDFEDSDNVVADETVNFGIDGVPMEIDLSANNASKFRQDMSKWIAKARVVGKPRRGGGKGAPSGYSKEQLDSMRQWGRRNGYTVKDQGRVPAEVRIAWEQNAGRDLPRPTPDLNLS